MSAATYDPPDSPEDGDYVLQNGKNGGIAVSEYNVGFLADFDNEDEALRWISARSNRERSYPAVWKLSTECIFPKREAY